MQRVDFFRLERAVQDRFVAAAQGGAPPAPLAFRPEAVPRKVYSWGLVSGLSLIALFACCTLGYGDLDSALALQPLELGAVYVALAALAAGAAFAAHRALRGRRALPFLRGTYLFPSAVIDTSGPELVVHPIAELSSTKASDRNLVVAFQDGASFRFPVPRAGVAGELAQQLESYKSRLSASTDVRELAALDPLRDNGFRNPFSPRESLIPPKRRWALGGFTISLLLGSAFGVGVFAARNVLAEAALYRRAVTTNTREAYSAYLARGGHNQNVAKILLPRAELSEILKRNSIDELRAFAEKQRDTPVAPEAEAALHQQLVTLLAKAKAEGTLAALKQFRDQFAEHTSIRADLDRAISERLTAALHEFEQCAKPKADVLDLFRRLLNYSATHEGRVELRFRKRQTDSVAKAEDLLQKNHYFGGKASLPGQYFDAQHSAPREKAMAEEIISTLGKCLSAEILRFEPAPPLADSPEEDPKLDVPTLLVSHRTEMSGMYMMRKPRAALTGVGILFRVTISLPNDPAIHAYKYSSWNAPDLRSMMNGESFQTIYSEMGDKAFARLTKKYLYELVPALVPKPVN